MNDREAAVRLWFQMWLTGEGNGILDLFTPDAVYIESWGPEYHGAARIRHWFCEWNTRGRVLRWEIRRFWHQGDRTAVGIRGRLPDRLGRRAHRAPAGVWLQYRPL